MWKQLLAILVNNINTRLTEKSSYLRTLSKREKGGELQIFCYGEGGGGTEQNAQGALTSLAERTFVRRMTFLAANPWLSVTHCLPKSDF